MEETKKKLIEVLKKRNDIDFLDNHSLWECEERMNADHFAMHKRPGILSSHIPLMPISNEELKEINSRI